jgi:hypothetical protein
LLNVLVTKMIADWFLGRELVTAMAILVIGWPLGIALAMVTVPALAEAWSWQTATVTGSDRERGERRQVCFRL